MLESFKNPIMILKIDFKLWLTFHKERNPVHIPYVIISYWVFEIFHNMNYGLTMRKLRYIYKV